MTKLFAAGANQPVGGTVIAALGRMLLPNFRHLRKTGFTMMETSIAVGMLGIFVAILITVSSNVLNLLRTSKDNVSASQNLQQRSEQLRLMNWTQVVSADSMKTDLLFAPTPSVSGLSAPIETITVSPYPAKAGFIPAKVKRENGAATVITSNPLLKDQPMVRVDLTLSWSGFPRKRDRVRSTSILVARPGPTK
jgi:type II secretory pathway pseudopilin PulG